MAPCEKFFSRKRRRLEKDEGGTVFSYAYDAWGRRTSRTIRFADGREAMEECRAYDKYGRLVEIAAFGTSVKWRYDARGRVVRQVVDGTPIDFAYTREGRLAGKWLGGREAPVSVLEYEYAKDGRVLARTANGVRQEYEHDARGQLLAVKENGSDVERYVYDGAGNMLCKTVRGKTTEFAFDGANQLVSSICDGVTTRYAYDAVGRLVREGDKVYRYGYLDKVLSVTEGERKYTYDYHIDGQLAKADYGKGQAEDFAWDGLALIRRGDEQFVNEPHVGGGNPILSSKGVAYFNDRLGITVGAWDGRTAQKRKAKRRYSAAALTAFGENGSRHTFFTGKPQVDGLGHAFLFRNYRAGLAKWQTADPLGYPDGWNQLAYGDNSPVAGFDVWGTVWSNSDFVNYYFDQDPSRSNDIDTDQMGLTDLILPVVRSAAENAIDSVVRSLINNANQSNGQGSQLIDPPFGVNCSSIVWAMGGGSGRAVGQIVYNWSIERFWYASHLYERKNYFWRFEGELQYGDDFKDPMDIPNIIDKDFEVPFGRPISLWAYLEQSISVRGWISLGANG